MYLLWYIVFCFTIAFIMAAVFKKQFEVSLITGQLAIIVMLYIFYVLDVLNVGVYVICFAIVGFSIYGICKVVKEHRVIESAKLLFRPAAFIFIMLLCLIYYTVRANSVGLIDELHLWAALPKILAVQEGKLQLKEAMLLGYADYLPGMPLYLYFLTRINQAISEPLLYFGYCAFGGAMLIPMCGRINSYKKFYTFPIMAFVLYLIPLTFYNSLYNDHAIYYKSIHVDPILGIAVGCAMFLLINKPWKSRFEILQFALILSFLAIVKTSGIAFVAVLLVSMFLYLWVFERNMLRQRWLYCLSLPILFYGIWKLCLNIYSTSDSVNYAIGDVIDFSYIKEFSYALGTKSIMQPRITELAVYCTFATIVLWFIIVFVVVWLFVRKRLKDDANIVKWSFVTLIVQMVVFVVGLYGLCVGPFQANLLSYGRYICTVLTACLVLLAYYLIYEFKIIVGCVVGRGKIGAIALVMLLLIGGFFYPLYRPAGISYPQIALRDADKIEKIINASITYSGEGAYDKAIMVVDKAYDSFSPDLHIYLQRRLYFNLIDEKIQINAKLYMDEEINSQKTDDENYVFSAENDMIVYDWVIWVRYISDNEKTVEIYQVDSVDEEHIYLHKVAGQKVS